MGLELLVNIDVDDLERATAFYTAALPLRVGRRFGGGGAVELLGAGAPIYLLAKPAGSGGAPGAARGYGRHWTPVHLDFAVDDLDAAVVQAVAPAPSWKRLPAPPRGAASPCSPTRSATASACSGSASGAMTRSPIRR
jgi:catechol 2,3-dioxygenase-like lactoylglutathione lyase family enzyme